MFTIISSHVTGIRIAKNNEESRFYFKLHPVSSEFSTFEQMIKKYNLQSKDFKEKRELLLVKLKLFLANFFNIGDELYPPMTTWKRGSTTVPLVHPLPTSHQVNQEHLFLNGDSIIFGGYGTSNQKPHADFGCETQGENKVSVSNNAKLEHKFKPSSIIIPLSDKREVYMVHDRNNSRIICVKKGQLLLFEGDKVHGGCTYKLPRSNTRGAPKKLPMYPSYHCYMESTHHQQDISMVDFDWSCLLGMDELKGHLKEEYPDGEMPPVKEAFQDLCQLVTAAADRLTETKRKAYQNIVTTCVDELNNKINKKSR